MAHISSWWADEVLVVGSGFATPPRTQILRVCLRAQVLPEGMLLLAEPSPAALAAALTRALTLVGTVNRQRQHAQVSVPSPPG